MANVIKIDCKYCKQEINIPAPSQYGTYAVTCPSCKGQMKVKYEPKPITVATPCPASPMNPEPAQTPTPYQNPSNSAQHNPTRCFNLQGGMSGAVPFGKPSSRSQVAIQSVGRLSLVRLGCDKQYFPLHVGENIIGRKDDSLPSDVAIDGDMTISRKSVKITVSHIGYNNYSYQLIVLKAANPVQVNGVPVAIGQTVQLMMGSSIFLGQTMLRLEK